MDVENQPHLVEIVAALKEITARITSATSISEAVLKDSNEQPDGTPRKRGGDGTERRLCPIHNRDIVERHDVGGGSGGFSHPDRYTFDTREKVRDQALRGDTPPGLALTTFP